MHVWPAMVKCPQLIHILNTIIKNTMKNKYKMTILNNHNLPYDETSLVLIITH